MENLGKPLDAVNLLERVAKVHSSELEVLRQLALLYSKNGCPEKARDAYQSLLQTDITDLDVLENFLALNYSHPAPKGTVTELITELAESLPRDAEFDAEAAVFVLPSMRLMAPADEAIRRLKYSESATARYLSNLATSEDPAIDEVDGSIPELREAQIIFSLIHGHYEIALKSLYKSPGLAGLRALKHAVQRELRANRAGNASQLLSKLILFEPNDEWARKEHDKLVRSRAVEARRELTGNGFPFPEVPIEQEYTPSPRKILYLLDESLPYVSGSYARKAHGLISALRARGWRAEAVTRLGYPTPAEIDDRNGESFAKTRVIDGNKYHRLSETELSPEVEPLEDYIKRYSDALYELALVEKPALIHAASNYWNGLASVIVARRLGIPSLYEVQDLREITEASQDPRWGYDGDFRLMKRMELDVAHAATRVLTSTQSLKSELIQRDIPAAKITVVPNAVDLSQCESSDADYGMQTPAGLEGRTIIVYSGSSVDEALQLLIEAISQLALKRNDFKLLVIGDVCEDQFFRRSVASKGLANTVIFAGKIPHQSLPAYYDLSDIIVSPTLACSGGKRDSHLETLEAMVSGKPLVASNVADALEIIKPGETGLLYEKGSTESLMECLELLLDKPGLGDRLGNNASQWLRDHRSLPRVSGQVTKVYEHLLALSRSDRQVLNDLARLESNYGSNSSKLLDAIFELGERHLERHLGQRILVHSALQRRSSRYSLRVVKLFAEYGLWELVSYLARHALPSVKNKDLAADLRLVFSKEHHLRKITPVRVSVQKLREHSQLVDAIAELVADPEAEGDQSVLSPRFLIIPHTEASDSSLLELASRMCGRLGIQLVVESSPTADQSLPSYSGSLAESGQQYPPTLYVIAKNNGSYSFHSNSPKNSSNLSSLGDLTQKEVWEVAAVHWLLGIQASAVLKLQRTVWRSRLIDSLAPILPLSTVPGAFEQVSVGLKDAPEAERYLQRAASALLSAGHYQGAGEVLSQISLDRRDARYPNKAAEAAFGTADFQKALDWEDSVEKSVRMNKILAESKAASRMLRRLEIAAQTESSVSVPRDRGALRVVSILHASVPDQSGGYANRAHALLRSLTEHGVKVRAYTRPGFPDNSLAPGRVEQHWYEDVPYHRLGSSRRRESGEYAYMEESIDLYRAVLEAEKPDVVHLRSTYVSALPALIAARELSIPTLYEVSGMWELVYASYRDARREGLRARTVRLENEVLSHVDRIVTLTEAMASEIRSRVVPKRPVTLVPNAVDLDRFKPQPKRIDLKTALGWQEDLPVIGYAGSLVDYEGLDVLLHASEILKRKGLEFKVLIIGDGAVKRDLEYLSERLKLTDTVRFTGRLPHDMVGEYYSIFDVCAFPRYLTPATRAVSPLKPFEALASAKPVVVSDIPALAEIVGKGSPYPRGMAVQENDPEALSEALERILTDSKLRNTISSNGLKWVEAERSWEAVSKSFAGAVSDASAVSATWWDEK